MLRVGDRVSTPHGPGTLAYERMAPPDYTRPAAFSVRLDAKADQPGYTGTIIAANVVRPLETGTT